jgi:hypothetical protein
MISFVKPTNLDGAVLIEELEANGIEVQAYLVNVKCPIIDGSGVLWLDIKDTDESAAQAVLDNHQG